MKEARYVPIFPHLKPDTVANAMYVIGYRDGLTAARDEIAVHMARARRDLNKERNKQRAIIRAGLARDVASVVRQQLLLIHAITLLSVAGRNLKGLRDGR